MKFGPVPVAEAGAAVAAHARGPEGDAVTIRVATVKAIPVAVEGRAGCRWRS